MIDRHHPDPAERGELTEQDPASRSHSCSPTSASRAIVRWHVEAPAAGAGARRRPGGVRRTMNRREETEHA
jgi:hypothetical protein